MTAERSESPTSGASFARPIRVGISACLLGETVRFDGGHKRDAFLAETFGRFVEWVPVCPEVECGLGTPRESIRLVRMGDDLKLMTVKTAVDLTSRMHEYVNRRVPALDAEHLSGFVLKKDSPSCGLERVKVYDRGLATRSGRGLFADALLKRYPHLPIEEEGRLSDPKLRENFVERVFAYFRLQTLFSGRWDVAALVQFHTAHKLILMAHSTEAYRELGQLTASAGRVSRRRLETRYTNLFMNALCSIATPRRHANVLQHMAGYFKNQLDAASKKELLAAIDDYRRGLIPLVVPITLVRHHVRVRKVEYLAGQLYLDPHPKELMLRNHV